MRIEKIRENEWFNQIRILISFLISSNNCFDGKQLQQIILKSEKFEIHDWEFKIGEIIWWIYVLNLLEPFHISWKYKCDFKKAMH